MTTGASNSPSSLSPDWLRRLLSDGSVDTTLPRAAIDRWLSTGRTNAEDLLAARQAGGGIEFLRLALTNFPNDPRVLFAAAALHDGAEARRERLDRFKAAAPDNALVDYLSARENLKNSRTEAAMVDLLAAGGKTSFQDYMRDAIQNAEDLYLQSGKTSVEAKVLAASTAFLPHLEELKGLALDLQQWQKQYLAAGDTVSAERLAQMGLQLGRQLRLGEGSGTILDQLVGISIERTILDPLDPAKSHDFLQGTIADHIAALSEQRGAMRQDIQFLNQWMVNAADTDLIGYLDRFKLYGESGAITWLRSRQEAR